MQAKISDVWNICQINVFFFFFLHFAAFLYAVERPAIMPLYYLVTKQLSGFCSHILNELVIKFHTTLFELRKSRWER